MPAGLIGIGLDLVGGGLIGSVGGLFSGLFGGGNPNSTSQNKKDLILGNGTATYGALYNHYNDKNGGIIHLTSSCAISDMWKGITPSLSQEYWDDRISGVELGPGCTIELYSDPNYMGVKKTYVGPCNIWLYNEGYDDRTSSFRFFAPNFMSQDSVNNGKNTNTNPINIGVSGSQSTIGANGHVTTVLPTATILGTSTAKKSDNTPMFILGGLGLLFLAKKQKIF